MEAMRKRFAAPRDLKHLSQGPHSMKVKPHTVQQQLKPDNSPNLNMRLSIDTSLELSDNTVTLYSSKPDTVANISTTSDPDAKIWTLESMNDFIRRSGRPNLDVLCEFPIAKRIIETFESKGVCLDALQLFLSNETNREPLVGWITEVWGEEEDNDTNKETDSIPESPGGSLFSDSDAPEVVVPHRVRPITLRPRQTPAPTLDIKSEFSKDQCPVKSEIREEIKVVPRRSASGRFRPASPRRRMREGSLEPSSVVARPKLKSVNSHPTLQHVSSRAEYSPEKNKKRDFLKTRSGEVRSENGLVKRTKTDKTIPPKSIEGRNAVSLKSGPQSMFPEVDSLVKVVDNVSHENLVPPSEDNKQFVSRFWKETVSGFSPAFQTMSTLDHLGYFFREIELLRKENDLIKRDELERRKEMLLFAERMKLMNQPVLRCSKNTK
jgi:hypothetical protein